MAHPDFTSTFADGDYILDARLNNMRDLLEYLKGKPHPLVSSLTVSAVLATNSYNDSASLLPTAAAGDSVAVSGFRTSLGNNGTRTVVSSVPGSLVVSGGAALANESPQSVTSALISASTTDDSFNHSGAGFPTFGAGARIKTSGFANAANNGEFTISSNTASKIVVAISNLVTESAGPSVTVQGPVVSMAFTQVKTDRDQMVKAPRFDHIGDAPDLKHTFAGSPGGSEFQLLGMNVDSPSAFTTGHKTRVILALRERDGGDERKLARLEVERTGVGAGSLTIDTYSPNDLNPDQQLEHNPPAFKIDSAGKSYINRASGTGQLNVGGDVRAAVFKKAGAAIGKWTLNNASGELPRMEYTGAAEVSGQWIVTSFSEEVMRVASTTKCTNVHASKLRGMAFPSATCTAKTTSAVSCPARFGVEFDQFTYTASTISVDPSDNSYNDSSGTFQPLARGDLVEGINFDAGVNNGQRSILSITPFKCIVTGGQPLFAEAAGVSRDLKFTSGYTTLCETPPVPVTGYYKLVGKATVTIGSASNLTNTFLLGITGMPKGGLGDYYSPFHAAGIAVGNLVQVVGVCIYRATAGERLRLSLANLTEANVSVTGEMFCKLMAPGLDVFPPLLSMPFTLYTPTAV